MPKNLTSMPKGPKKEEDDDDEEKAVPGAYNPLEFANL
jgi:hypothetical protein